MTRLRAARLFRAGHNQNKPPFSGWAAGVARQIDKLQHGAIGIMEIGARAVEHAALPILLESDLDAMSAQMLKRSRVLVVRHSEGMMHTAMVIEHGVDRRVADHHEPIDRLFSGVTERGSRLR